MSVRIANLSFGPKIKAGHLFMGLSLVFALLTGFIIRNLVLEQSQASAAPTLSTHPIVVAKGNIPMGSTLTAEHLRIASWPTEYLPTGATYQDTSTLIGRVVKHELHPGEPVYQEVLSGESSTGGLKVLIPKGLRAMTVAVTEVKGVAGFVKPGDRVDVIATFKDMGLGGNSDLKVTQTVLQNVQVIAAAQEMTHEGASQADPLSQIPGLKTSSPKPESNANLAARAETGDPAKIVNSVTLAITPAQIEKLALADETGTIRLVLRPEADNTIAKVSGVTHRDLLSANGAGNPAVKPAQQKQSVSPNPLLYVARPAYTHVAGRVIEMIDGTKKSEVAF